MIHGMHCFVGSAASIDKLRDIHLFIIFLGRWADHDHLTSNLKHIINQTNI